jgi:alanyl aminopeptidase
VEPGRSRFRLVSLGWLGKLVARACASGLLVAGACVGSTPAGPPLAPQRAPVAAPPAPPPDVDGHLPPTAAPQRYRVTLRLDPSKERFSGAVSIDVTVPAPTWNVVLNGRGLNVTRATASVGPRSLAATVASRLSPDSTTPDELVLTFGEPLPAGSATLAIEYDAPFAPDLAGVYRVEQGGRSYVFSQFETADARRAMPCFDEPEYKTPYEVTVAAPRGVVALSNAPEVAADDGPDGTSVHRFAPTPPLPSYLVAVAVGDFDIAEGRRSPVPIRVITTKGHGNQVAAALEATDGLVTKLAEYFAMPYPFAKLDLVAVPDLSAGAMENPGLLTFRETLLVQDPARSTTGLRRAQAVTIAHELAHQWVGDLVTMRWWDDLWLNEGFATWAEAMAVDAWQPSFGATLDEIGGLGHVMDADGLASARAVRQPVRSVSEADEAFDTLTYDKGAAVLRMIERWMGPDTFRRGVQRYLRENAWKTAQAGDLFHALDYVSTERVEPFASPFLDHAGVPEVFARKVCTAGKSTLELRQERWVPLGEPAAPASTQGSWAVPVCVAVEGHKEAACFTLGQEPIARELGPGCPAWFHPNADGVGYYRFALDGGQMLALARAGRALDPMQRLGVVSNAWAAVRAGALDPSALLDVLRAFDGESDRRVLSEIGSVVRSVDDALVDDAVRDRYARFVAARFGATKRSLGWKAAPGDTDDRAIVRQTVLSAMGDVAHDEATLTEAEGYARKWLHDPSSIPSDVAAVAVPMASMRAGKERLDALRAFAKQTESIQDRVVALRAMGSFEDPAVLFEAFDAATGGEVKLSELRHVFGAAIDHRAARPALYAWEKAHWAKLNEHLPGSFGRAQLVGVAGVLCTAPERADAQAFFVDAVKSLEGMKRPLDEALETSALCVALREHGAADLSRYLLKN